MTRDDEKYNGWTNYATWRINLEICDEYISNREADGDTFTDVETLADHLKDYVDEVLTEYGNREEGLALDYARAFVDDVDWYEIAEHAEGLIETEEDDGE